MFLLEEGKECRRLARALEGRVEAPFLLNAANAFEKLARDGASWRSARGRRIPSGEPAASQSACFDAATIPIF